MDYPYGAVAEMLPEADIALRGVLEDIPPEQRQGFLDGLLARVSHPAIRRWVYGLQAEYGLPVPNLPRCPECLSPHLVAFSSARASQPCRCNLRLWRGRPKSLTSNSTLTISICTSPV